VWEKAFGEGGAWSTLTAPTEVGEVSQADFRLALSDIDDTTVAWLKAGMVHGEEDAPILKQLIAANFFYHTANRWHDWILDILNESYHELQELQEPDEVDEKAIECAKEVENDWKDREIFLSVDWGPLGLTVESGHQWWLSQTAFVDCIGDLGDNYA
jgi:hypothetical protein